MGRFGLPELIVLAFLLVIVAPLLVLVLAYFVYRWTRRSSKKGKH